MSARVRTVDGLSTISRIIALHNEVWNNSTGIIDLLKNSSRCYTLVEDDGRLAGYAFVEEDKKRGFVELQDIAVAPACRGRGDGRRLMKSIMSDCERIKLLARAANTDLIAFYRNLGFEEESRIENYYEVGEDGVRMSWTKPEPGDPRSQGRTTAKRTRKTRVKN